MRFLLLFSFCTILTCTVFSQSQETFASVKIKTLSGKEVDFATLSSQSKDTAIIVSFWATWCGPCVTELESLNDQYQEKQKIKPFKLYAISVDDARTAQRVRSFVKGKGWEFDVYQDINNDLKRALNINDIPHVIIIKNNKIVYQHTGYINGNEVELFDTIKTL